MWQSSVGFLFKTAATSGFHVRIAEAECARDCKTREGKGLFGILDPEHRKEHHIMANWRPEIGRNAGVVLRDRYVVLISDVHQDELGVLKW